MSLLNTAMRLAKRRANHRMGFTHPPDSTLLWLVLPGLEAPDSLILGVFEVPLTSQLRKCGYRTKNILMTLYWQRSNPVTLVTILHSRLEGSEETCWTDSATRYRLPIGLQVRFM
jgi:hypothetical protein